MVCLRQDPDHLFLVGSEDGRLRKCSTAYNSQALLAYDGHAGAVYAVQWNGCHPATFLSASADWTVKLWHSNRPRVCTLPACTSQIHHMQSPIFPAASALGKAPCMHPA